MLNLEINDCTIKNLRQWGRSVLSSNVEYNIAALETDMLLSKALNESRLYLEIHSQELVAKSKLNTFMKDIEKRKNGCPIAYITGHKEFMGYDFCVNNYVLIPRDDTQTVIDVAIGAIQKRKNERLRGLEIGVGSGIISLIILSNLKNVTIIGTDINEKAIELTLENALYLDKQLNDEFLDMEITERLKLVCSDMFENVDIDDNSIDFIISNPPYIPSLDVLNLSVDVRDYEPRLALDGGEDGLDCYRKILEYGIVYLREGGFVAFEIGYDQADRIYEIMQDYGLSNISIYKDLSNLDRAIIGYKL